MLNLFTHAVAKIRGSLADAVAPSRNIVLPGDDINDEVTVAFRLANIDGDGDCRKAVSVYARLIRGGAIDERPRGDPAATRHRLPPSQPAPPFQLSPPFSGTPAQTRQPTPPSAFVGEAGAHPRQTPAATIWSPPPPPPPPPAPPSPRPPQKASRPPLAVQARTADRPAQGLPPALSPALSPTLPPRVLRTVPSTPALEPATSASASASASVSASASGSASSSASALPPHLRSPRAQPRPALDLDTILDIAAGRRQEPEARPTPRSAPRPEPARVWRGGQVIPVGNRSGLSRSVREMGVGSDAIMGREWRSCVSGLNLPAGNSGLASSLGDLGVGSGGW